MAKLKADGQPLLLGVPEQIGAEDQQGRQGPGVGPGGAQGLGVRPEDGPEKDRADQGHSVLAQQTQAGGQTRRDPTAPVPTQGRQALMQRQGPGQGQGGIGGRQDPRHQSGEGRAGQDQGQGLLTALQPADTVKPRQDQQGQSRGQQITQPARQG